MKKTIAKSNNAKTLSTIEETLAKLTPKQREKYDQEYQEFALSELLLAIMDQDTQSVRKLAKLAGVSPTIIQSMRSGEEKDYSLTVFFKVLQGLGYKKFTVTTQQGKNINIPLPNYSKKTNNNSNIKGFS